MNSILFQNRKMENENCRVVFLKMKGGFEKELASKKRAGIFKKRAAAFQYNVVPFCELGQNQNR